MACLRSQPLVLHCLFAAWGMARFHHPEPVPQATIQQIPPSDLSLACVLWIAGAVARPDTISGLQPLAQMTKWRSCTGRSTTGS